MSTLSTPRNPVASSPDDDPTGVRALLSALPEPEPMPYYLVERISASLAAEQAQRSASFSGASLVPLRASNRRRPGRLLFGIASAAAAVALIGFVGSNLLKTGQTTTASDSAASAITSSPREADGAAGPSGTGQAAPGSPSTPADIQIRFSQTRYTLAGFATQTRTLHSAEADRIPQGTGYRASVGRIGTAAGLTACLSAIGAGGAQMVRADVALYEGQPAVIIVATTDGIPTAYAVGRDCSPANPAILHPASPLP